MQNRLGFDVQAILPPPKNQKQIDGEVWDRNEHEYVMEGANDDETRMSLTSAMPDF